MVSGLWGCSSRVCDGGGKGLTKPAGVSQACLVTGCVPGPMPLDLSVRTPCAEIRAECQPL
jgi:hypothetical protein